MWLWLVLDLISLASVDNSEDRLRNDKLKCYALRYPDLLHGYCKDDSEKCDFDGLEKHFKESGIHERRILGCIAEDVKCYAQRYPDLAAAFCAGSFKSCTHESYVELLKHFSVAGLKEGREFGCRAEVSQQATFVSAVKAARGSRDTHDSRPCRTDLMAARNLSIVLSQALEVQNIGVFRDMTQAQFIISKICSLTDRPQQLCEVGFKTGHSAMLFLQTIPNSSVVSFGIGDTKPSVSAAQLLKQAYNGRFEAVLGPLLTTIPNFHQTHPEMRCDVVIMDDARDYGERLIDIFNMRAISSPGALLILRQICSKECARSTSMVWGPSKLPCTICQGGASVAYGKAHQLGLIRVGNCMCLPVQLLGVTCLHIFANAKS